MHNPLGQTPEKLHHAGMRLALYQRGPAGAGPAAARPLRCFGALPPLLLVHSVNAAASAYEMKPIFNGLAAHRSVAALELPGFGHSSREAMRHTPGRMADAVHHAVQVLSQRHGGAAIDVMALSLGCEFAALAALRAPDKVRSLGFISPTGLRRKDMGQPFAGGRTLRNDTLARCLQGRVLGPALFRVLTTRPSMRWFLEGAFGSPAIDEGLLDAGHRSAHLPGAHHAPLAFVSGALFTQGVASVYQRLPMPVWVVHGVRGRFADTTGLAATAAAAKAPWLTHALDTGALPHFEQPSVFLARYQDFCGRVAQGLGR